MSGVMEGGVKYVKSPGNIYRCNDITLKICLSSNVVIYRAVQPVLYKAVFHGGLKSMWSSVMEDPKIGEMRRMGRCIQNHDRCVEQAILSQYL